MYAELLRQPLPDNLTAPLRAGAEPSPRDVLEGAVAVLRSENPASSDATLTALLPKAKSAQGIGFTGPSAMIVSIVGASSRAENRDPIILRHGWAMSLGEWMTSGYHYGSTASAVFGHIKALLAATSSP